MTEHTPFIHLHEIYSSAIHAYPPFTRYIQDTFWEMIEDMYEDTLLPHQTLLVSYFTMTYQGQSLHVDFQSKKINCPNAAADRPCWERYVVHYLEGEPSPMPWNLNGTQHHP